MRVSIKTVDSKDRFDVGTSSLEVARTDALTPRTPWVSPAGLAKESYVRFLTRMDYMIWSLFLCRSYSGIPSIRIQQAHERFKNVRRF